MLYLFFIVVIVQVKGKWATKSKCHNPICMKLIFVTFLQSVHFRDELLAENQLRFDKKTVQKPASKKFLRIQPTHQTSIHFNMRFNFKTLAFLKVSHFEFKTISIVMPKNIYKAEKTGTNANILVKQRSLNQIRRCLTGHNQIWHHFFLSQNIKVC